MLDKLIPKINLNYQRAKIHVFLNIFCIIYIVWISNSGVIRLNLQDLF